MEEDGRRRKSNLLPPNEFFSASDCGGLTSCAEARMHSVYYNVGLARINATTEDGK